MATAKKAAAKKAPAKKAVAKKSSESEVKYGQAPGEVHFVAPRDPNGVYLDEVNDVKDELRRAERENRKPRLSGMAKPAVNHVIPTKG